MQRIRGNVYYLLVCLFVGRGVVWGQNPGIKPECYEIFKDAKLIYERARKTQLKQDPQYELAINKLAACRICDPLLLDSAEALLIKIYNDINSQKDIALMAKNEAYIERNKALKNRDIALALASEVLISQGEMVLSNDPAMSIAYAYEATKLNYSPKAPSLIWSAIERTPEWRRIVLNGTQDGNLLHGALLSIAVNLGPSVIVDSSMKTLVAVESLPEGSKNSNRLVLIDLKNDTVVASRQLKATETLIVPPGVKTRLFALKAQGGSENHAYVFDLIAGNLQKNLLKLYDVEEIAFSNGGFPIFYSTNGDSIFRLSKEGALGFRRENLGCYRQVKRIWAHPSGNHMIVHQVQGLQYLTIPKGDTVIKKNFTDLVANRSICSFIDSKVCWHSDPSRLILGFSYTSNEPSRSYGKSLVAIDVEAETTEILYDLQQNHPRDTSIIFTTDSKLQRLGYYLDDNGSEDSISGLYVMDLEWSKQSASPIIVEKSKKLLFEKEIDVVSRISQIELSPSGLYLIIPENRITSGGGTTGGRCYSWDLSSEEMNIKSLQDFAGRLQYGGKPIKQVVHSNDSKKVLVIDVDNNCHFFKIRDDPSDSWRRTDDEITQRFRKKATIVGERNQVIRVGFTTNEVEYFSLTTSEELKIATFLEDGETIVAERIIGDINQALVVTNKRIIKVTNGKLKRWLPLPSRHRTEKFVASIDNLGYCFLNYPEATYIYNENLDYLNKVSHASCEVDGIRIWLYARGEKRKSLFAIYGSSIYSYETANEFGKIELIDSLSIVQDIGEMLFSASCFEDYLLAVLIRKKHFVDQDSFYAQLKLFRINPEIAEQKFDLPLKIEEYSQSDYRDEVEFETDLFRLSATEFCGILTNMYISVVAKWEIDNDFELDTSFHTIPNQDYQKIKSDLASYPLYFSCLNGDSLEIYSFNNEHVESIFVGARRIPPACWLRGANRFELVGNQEQYLELDRHIMMGGYTSPMMLTNVKIPKRMRQQIDQIVHNLNE